MGKIIVLLLLMYPLTAVAQELARFNVKPVNGAGVVPVSFSPEGVNYNTDSGRIALFETGAAGEKEIAVQLETGPAARLWFHFDNKEGEKEYFIRRVRESPDESFAVSFVNKETVTLLLKDNRPVLGYNHSKSNPPAGVDPIYGRSAFIHPVWSPGGEILTRIQPPDHYHHYGIWNPWTSVSIDGREVDFWNLAKGQGTVNFSGYLNSVMGAVYSGVKVHHEHVYFEGDGNAQIALNEIWDIRLWETGSGDPNMADIYVTLNTPMPGGIVLNAYRYGGGIGYRATERWHKDNTTVLTSEGKARAEADGTNARWCIVEGESSVQAGRSGILFLSHPANRMHPEPMRVWPADANGGRGDMFFQFCPVRHAEWDLEPGISYTLKYRLVIFDGDISAEDAEMYWLGFASAPVINPH